MQENKEMNLASKIKLNKVLSFIKNSFNLKNRSSKWLLASIFLLCLFSLMTHKLQPKNTPSKAAAEFLNELLTSDFDSAFKRVKLLEIKDKSQTENKQLTYDELVKIKQRILQNGRLVQISAKKGKSNNYGMTIDVPVTIAIEYPAKTAIEKNKLLEKKEIIRLAYANKEWKVVLEQPEKLSKH